jgi:hypothetical protein
MSFDIEFQSEEELKKPLPEGTIAKVKLRPQYDRDAGGMLPLGELRTGKSKKGDPFVIIPVEVVDGEHAGEWAGTTLFIRQDDRRFRKAFEVITGIDVTDGGKVNFDDFTEKLKTGIFEVELGPERPRKGSDEPPKYTEIKKWFGRAGERDDLEAAAPAGATSVEDEFPGGEDIPF